MAITLPDISLLNICKLVHYLKWLLQQNLIHTPTSTALTRILPEKLIKSNFTFMNKFKINKKTIYRKS